MLIRNKYYSTAVARCPKCGAISEVESSRVDSTIFISTSSTIDNRPPVESRSVTQPWNGKCLNCQTLFQPAEVWDIKTTRIIEKVGSNL
jgi:hypothetical protein